MESKTKVVGSEEVFILSILQSVWKNRCISVIVGLKIPELLCTTEQPSLSIEDIAKKSGCASSKGLYPVMKVLAQWGIGKELDNKHFTKNRGMQLLRRDKGPSLGHAVEYYYSEEHFSAMRSLAACVKRGQSAFLLEHGMDHFQYMNDIENHPYDKKKMFEGSSVHPIGSDGRRREFAENYSSAMVCISYLTTLPDVQGINNVLEAFPWSTCKRLLDMGGGSGYFLSSVLKLPGCEHIQGHVVDLPDVIDDAQKTFEFSLEIPAHRIEFVKHDFTQPFPIDLQLQVDTVVFKDVLGMFIDNHDVTAKILLNCRTLFPSHGGRLLIIDYSMDDTGDKDSSVGINGFDLEVYSIHWLSICGVRQLTKAEWIKNLQEIGAKVGYEVKRVYDTFLGGLTIYELSCTAI